MPTLDIVCKDWQQFRLSSSEDLSVDAPDTISLRKTILNIHGILPIDRLFVNAQEFPAKYEVQLNDGRVWKQNILDSSLDPPMTFTVRDAWKLSEFSTLRAIRDLVVRMIHSGITKIDAKPR